MAKRKGGAPKVEMSGGEDLVEFDKVARASEAIEQALRPFSMRTRRKLLRMLAIHFDMDQVDEQLRGARVR